MTGWATGLRLIHPDNREEARLYYENKEGKQMKPKNDTRMTLRLPDDVKKDVYYRSKGKPNKWINEAIQEKLNKDRSIH